MSGSCQAQWSRGNASPGHNSHPRVGLRRALSTCSYLRPGPQPHDHLGGRQHFRSLPDLTDVWVLTNANGLDKATGPAHDNPIGLNSSRRGTTAIGVSFPGREGSTGVYDSTTNRMIGSEAARAIRARQKRCSGS